MKGRRMREADGRIIKARGQLVAVTGYHQVYRMNFAMRDRDRSMSFVASYYPDLNMWQLGDQLYDSLAALVVGACLQKTSEIARAHTRPPAFDVTTLAHDDKDDEEGD
jgi:hypothetical protein